MNVWLRSATLTAAMGLVALAISGPVSADGMDKRKSMKDAAMAEPPKSDWSITYNFAATTEYVFRGISQSAENPTVQGGVDVAYKIFYAGIWSSGIDFGRSVDPWAEVDWYAGVKPVVGPVTFDIGVIYYTYPSARDPGAELDYVEVKVGASGEIWKDGTLGVTVYYSPEYTGKTGDVWTFEGSFSQVLPKWRDITPTFSALLGYQVGDSAAYKSVIANGDDNYLYWNVGLTLGFTDRFSIDLRYWDTNISDSGGFCSGQLFQCDERFVATAKVTY
jgi:uncharacterized protein (TIGR02001 family)